MSTLIAMKTLVLIWSCVLLVQAESSNEDHKKKMSSKSSNIIQPGTKQPIYYQQFQYQPLQRTQQVQPIQHVQLQPQQQTQQLIPVQILQKPYYTTQQATHHPTMVIITSQPQAVASPNIYGSATQQLLNYFHSNPQAKYQFLHGNQQQIAQPEVVQQVAQPHQQLAQPHQQVAQTQHVGNYQIVSAPAYQQSNLVYTTPQVAATHYQSIPTQAQQPVAQAQTAGGNYIVHQPMQLTQIAHLAQLAAQQYANYPSLKTAPAIVTGFENFSPEQQAQIKTQLASHLGTPLSIAPQPQQQQYSSRYLAVPQQSLNTDEFIPSQQIKNDIPESNSRQDSAEATAKSYNKG